MKTRFIAVVVGLATAASMSYAQEVAPSVGAGSKAMLFSFSGLSTLGAGAYNGGFGAKYFLMNSLALRAGLQFGWASQEVKTTLATGGKDGSNSGTIFGITAGAEYHFGFNRVSPFFGGEIQYSMASTKQVLPVNVANGPEVTNENTGAILGISPGNACTIAGLGGVEFFVTKEISLSAEYQLGFGLPMGYKAKVTTKTGTGTTEFSADVPGTTVFGIGNSGALTLAVYF